MPGADCDSDHAPVLCKLLVKLRKLKKPQLQTKFNIMKLKSDRDVNNTKPIDSLAVGEGEGALLI